MMKVFLLSNLNAIVYSGVEKGLVLNQTITRMRTLGLREMNHWKDYHLKNLDRYA